MSPKKRDPKARTKLIDIAARLLAEEGPKSLSTRRVAAEAGTSTMAVYTHFGSMSGLVREIAHEGFARLERCFAGVAETADPVADLALYGRAYRHTAVTNPHVYAVMFGGASLAGFELTEADRQHGRYTMAGVVDCARRCVEAERFQPVEPLLAAHHMWLATHGLVTLELGNYLLIPCDAGTCFESQLVALMVGKGDSPEAATQSVAASADRFDTEVVTPPASKAG